MMRFKDAFLLVTHVRSVPILLEDPFSREPDFDLNLAFFCGGVIYEILGRK